MNKKTSEISILKLNFISLSLLQALNYGLPLLILPFLLRILGPSNYGLLSFSMAVTAYFLIVIDYGFNLSATRQISINRESLDRISEISISIIYVKLILIVASFVALNIIVFSFEKFKNDWLLYYFSFISVVLQSLFPVWLFQGLELMKYIALIQLFSKFLFASSILIFISNEKDYLLVPLCTSFGNIIAILLSLYVIRGKINLKKIKPSYKLINYQLKDGLHVFLSTVAASMYTLSCPVILGLVSTNAIVGFYSAADKLIQGARGVYIPFSQAFYPFITKKLVVYYGNH